MDLISRQALAERKFPIKECNGAGEVSAYRIGWNDAIDAIIDNEPSAEPERKTGKWIPKPIWQGAESSFYACSECDYRSWSKDNYCSVCGAKMEGT